MHQLPRSRQLVQLALAGDEETNWDEAIVDVGGMMKGWFPTRKSEQPAYIYIYIFFFLVGVITVCI